MGIQLINPKERGATPALLIMDAIEVGKKYIEVARQSRFSSERLVNDKIAEMIRFCNMFLGMSGNFKNGCLYREKGLSRKWTKGCGESVICDHAVPVAELVRKYKENEGIETLIFSPVVRITKESNEKLTKEGLAKTGHLDGFPLFRYSKIGMKIVTHNDTEVNPITWTDSDHWELVRSTAELHPILETLGKMYNKEQ